MYLLECEGWEWLKKGGMNSCVHVVLVFVTGWRYLMAGERSKPVTTVTASLEPIHACVHMGLGLCVCPFFNVSLRV